MTFLELPKIDPDADTCVRRNLKTKQIELVVDGEVRAIVSEFAYKNFRIAQERFIAAVAAAIKEREIDDTVDRLYPDDVAAE